MGLNELWAVWMFFYVDRFVSFRSFLWLAMLARSRVATMRFSRADKRPIALSLYFFSPFLWRPPSLGRRVRKKEIHTFILPFFSFPPPRSWTFLPVGQHSRALFRVRTGSEMFNDGVSQHFSFLLWETGRGNLKCAIMCCCYLRTQFLNGIRLHTHTLAHISRL